MTMHSHRQTGPTLPQVVASVAASFFGVQSARNRARDVTTGQPWHYVVVALLMTGLVTLGFYGAAQLALHLAATG